MWGVLKMYGANGNLLDRIESSYAESETCVFMCRQESDI